MYLPFVTFFCFLFVSFIFHAFQVIDVTIMVVVGMLACQDEEVDAAIATPQVREGATTLKPLGLPETGFLCEVCQHQPYN